MNREIFIGYDPREADAYDVAERSIASQWSEVEIIKPIVLTEMREAELYWREHKIYEDSNLTFDVISEAPMSTEFALTRFLTPHLSVSQWALFVDCDVMARCDLNELFALADERYAVQVVKHMTHVSGHNLKMDGQIQTHYPCKNWSSVMLWNVEHPANKNLTLDLINTARGIDLHRFCWLDPSEIGSLPPTFNHLVGVDQRDPNAKLVHFTLGIPRMVGYDIEHAVEWALWHAKSR